MELNDLHRHNVQFAKSMYDLGWSTWSTMYDYGEKMMELTVGQNAMADDRSSKLLKDWIENGRKVRDELRRNMDSMFDRFQDAPAK